jgi:hypothetical protein
MLAALHLRVSCWNPGELDLLRATEHPAIQRTAEGIIDTVLAACGHTTAPSEPRFSKTRRMLSKKRDKGLRGERAGRVTAEERASQAAIRRPRAAGGLALAVAGVDDNG